MNEPQGVTDLAPVLRGWCACLCSFGFGDEGRCPAGEGADLGAERCERRLVKLEAEEDVDAQHEDGDSKGYSDEHADTAEHRGTAPGSGDAAAPRDEPTAPGDDLVTTLDVSVVGCGCVDS